tara:strand:- start:450 stop:935 length:486 start_codon:yes stop_codon:yes gene_type:complete
MSTLKVDTINEKTSGNGVQIPGHIIQTVFVNDSNEYSNNTTSYTDTNLTGTITPKFASSKILITSQIAIDAPVGIQANMRLLRGSTVLQEEGYWLFLTSQNTNDYMVIRQPHFYLDTPSTTSAITYKWQMKRLGGTALAFYVSYDDSVQTDSQIILQEIAQ